MVAELHLPRPPPVTGACIRRALHPLGRLASSLTAGVLIFAAIGKTIDPGETLRTLGYLLSIVSIEDSEAIRRFLLSMLVGTEFLGGVLILTRVRTLLAHLAAVVMLGAFIFSIVVLITTRAPVGCGCGLGSTSSAEWSDFVRTAALLAVAAFALCTNLDRQSMHFSSRPGIQGT